MTVKETITIPQILSNNGIISKLQILNFLPEDISLQECIDIDMLYYLQYSGSKKIAPVWEKIIEAETLNEIPSSTEQLAKMLGIKFSFKWKNVYRCLNFDYDPLITTKYVETENVNLSIDSKTEKSTKIIENNTNNAKDDIYGFNSINPSPSDKSLVESNSETIQEPEFNNQNSQDIKTGETMRQITGFKDISQTKMINDRMELLKKIFIEILFKDIDSILTLYIY